MTCSAYEEIRNDVIECADSSCRKLDDFKLMYNYLINSTRLSSRIRTFKELITVLEKRHFVSEENVEVLHQIASSLNNKTIVVKIEEYQQNCPERKVNSNNFPARHVSRNTLRSSPPETVTPVWKNVQKQVPENGSFMPSNTMASCVPAHFEYNPHLIQQCTECRHCPSAPAYVPRLPKEAVDVISDEIGSSWKQFARLIAVKEGEIDEFISRNDMSIKEKAVQCLQLFEQRTRHCDVRKLLHAGLSKVRRNDVIEQIDDTLISAGF